MKIQKIDSTKKNYWLIVICFSIAFSTVLISAGCDEKSKENKKDETKNEVPAEIKPIVEMAPAKTAQWLTILHSLSTNDEGNPISNADVAKLTCFTIATSSEFIFL